MEYTINLQVFIIYSNLKILTFPDLPTKKKRVLTGKRYLERTSELFIQQDLRQRCCPAECLMKFAFDVILAIRTTFWAMVTMDQNKIIHQHRQHQVSEERCILNGVLVCSECWRVVHGVSRSRLVDCLPLYIFAPCMFLLLSLSDQAMVIGIVNYGHFLFQRTSEPQT